MEHAPPWLINSLIYLGAAVFAVPLSKALGLGSIIGYLAAGIAIGPWGLGLVTEVEDILHFAEFGVVLMLFLVGLELQPRRLWQMRRPIFGWGSAQVLACAALLFTVGWGAGVPWRIALVAALGLALSSTAVALQVMGERNHRCDGHLPVPEPHRDEDHYEHDEHDQRDQALLRDLLTPGGADGVVSDLIGRDSDDLRDPRSDGGGLLRVQGSGLDADCGLAEREHVRLEVLDLDRLDLLAHLVDGG